MTQKKLMLLGGLRYLLPVIEAAHRHSIHVITVDYPNATRMADTVLCFPIHHQLSTTDQQRIIDQIVNK